MGAGYGMRGLGWNSLALLAALGAMSLPAAAQVRTVDPNSAIDRDLAPPPPPADNAPTDAGEPVAAEPAPQHAPPPPSAAPAPVAQTADGRPADPSTYTKGDVLDAAEGVFGKGAKGLAELVEKVLKDQGQPNAYIAGR